MHIAPASASSPLVQPSVLLGYEASMNPYVGCGGGCTFCYAQQMIKEPGHAWGQFVRTRDHIERRLASQWAKFCGKSLLIGSMTDPYQPVEQTRRLTRQALQILLQNPPSRLGIFTRYDTVLQDLQLLQQFPQVTVHMSLSPFAAHDLHLFEPNTPPNARRLAAIERLADAGIECHSQVSPLTPGFSDQRQVVVHLLDQIAKSSLIMARLDPLQAYSAAQHTILGAMGDRDDQQVRRFRQVMVDSKSVLEWANQQRGIWAQTWCRSHLGNSTRLVWANHIAFEWVDLVSGEVTRLPRKGDAAS